MNIFMKHFVEYCRNPIDDVIWGYKWKNRTIHAILWLCCSCRHCHSGATVFALHHRQLLLSGFGNGVVLSIFTDLVRIYSKPKLKGHLLNIIFAKGGHLIPKPHLDIRWHGLDNVQDSQVSSWALCRSLASFLDRVGYSLWLFKTSPRMWRLSTAPWTHWMLIVIVRNWRDRRSISYKVIRMQNSYGCLFHSISFCDAIHSICVFLL